MIVSIVSLFSCKKKEDDAPDQSSATTSSTSTTTLTSSTPESIQFTLAYPPTYTTTVYNYTVPAIGTWYASSGGLNIQPSLPNYYSKVVNYYNNGGQNVFIITKKDSTNETTTPISEGFFRNYLKKGNHNYARSTSGSLFETCGINISVKDNAGIWWYTVNPNNGKSIQTITSSFNITDVFEYSDFSNLNIKYKNTFSCKLYNSSGDSVYLTSGKMLVHLSK